MEPRLMEHSRPTRATTGSTDRPVALLPGVLLSLGIVAALATTAAVEQSGDSLAYLTKARDGGGLFHPHHLLFNAAVRSVYLGLAAVTGVRDVVLAAQVHNLFFTFVALLAVYWIGLRWLGSQGLGILGLALYGSTTGILVFATQAEVYVPSVAALGVATVFFFRLIESPQSKSARVGLVVAWVIAVLYHQTAVLFLIPMAMAVLVARSRDLARALVTVSAGAGAVVLGAYWLAYRSAAVSSSEPLPFLRFVLSYAIDGGVNWGQPSNLGAAGVIRLLESHLWGLSALIPERPGVLIAFAVAGATAFVAAARFAGPRARLLLCFAISWAVTFLGFFLWWFPGEMEFAVLTSMPVCLAAIAGACPFVVESRIGATGARIVVAAMVVIAIVNFYGSLRLEVLPRHRSRGQASIEPASCPPSTTARPSDSPSTTFPHRSAFTSAHRPPRSARSTRSSVPFTSEKQISCGWREPRGIGSSSTWPMSTRGPGTTDATAFTSPKPGCG